MKSKPTTLPLAEIPIRRYQNGNWQAVNDVTATEEPLQIRIQQHGQTRTLAITMRTPGDDIALAAGFLFAEGMLEGNFIEAKQIQESRANVVTIQLNDGQTVDWNKLERHSYTSSSCGVCGKTSLEQVFNALPYPEPLQHWTIEPTLVTSLPDCLRQNQQLFDQTGGIHAAGLFTLTGQLIACTEDVGRHNALDKLIGGRFLAGQLPLENEVLVLSGRASFELIQKAAMAGIRVVIAVGAPSSLAVSLAEDQGITLCGFTKKTGFNCYAHPKRIKIPEPTNTEG